MVMSFSRWVFRVVVEIGVAILINARFLSWSWGAIWEVSFGGILLISLGFLGLGWRYPSLVFGARVAVGVWGLVNIV